MADCCRESSSQDVLDYLAIDKVTRLLYNTERFKADLDHPVKGDKLRALIKTLEKIQG